MVKASIGMLAACLIGADAVVAAEHTSVSVAFKESAPKDSFVVRNTGNCHAKPMQLRIDLGPSQGRLIFDTTALGAGVEVFQPFEITKGQELVAKPPSVRDGDDQLELQLASLSPNASLVFTIDVDDTLVKSAFGQTRVTGPEIEGATVSVDLWRAPVVMQAAFSPNATAVLHRIPCNS